MAPAIGEQGVSATTSVVIGFSLPMDTARTGASFTLTDGATGQAVVGTVTWSDGQTMTFVPSAALGRAHVHGGSRVRRPGRRRQPGDHLVAVHDRGPGGGGRSAFRRSPPTRAWSSTR